MAPQAAPGPSPARPHSRPDKRALLWSGGVHAVVVVTLVIASLMQRAPAPYETIRIQIFSPPPAAAEEVQTPAPVEEELVVETPEPEDETPVLEPEEEVTPPPETTPEPEPAPPEPEPEQPEEATTESPEAEPTEESGEDLNVRLEGLRRDYPEYYGNIVRQLRRCFRAPPGNHSATVRFLINADGTVSEIETVESSGNLAFEIRALEAVECAGGGRFGPLPDDFPWDALPVEFFFAPNR